MLYDAPACHGNDSSCPLSPPYRAERPRAGRCSPSSLSLFRCCGRLGVFQRVILGLNREADHGLLQRHRPDALRRGEIFSLRRNISTRLVRRLGSRLLRPRTKAFALVREPSIPLDEGSTSGWSATTWKARRLDP